MTAPVQDAGRWWSEGQRLPDDERTALLATLVDQVQGSFPPATEVYRSFLSCYPRHALLRFELPSEAGLRTSFAFYAGGQLYPLDSRGSTFTVTTRPDSSRWTPGSADTAAGTRPMRNVSRSIVLDAI